MLIFFTLLIETKASAIKLFTTKGTIVRIKTASAKNTAPSRNKILSFFLLSNLGSFYHQVLANTNYEMFKYPD